MKKLLFALIALVVLIAVGSVILYQLIKPAERLDLSYEKVDLEKKAVEMLKRVSTQLALSEADVNNLAKESIAQNPMYTPDARITGARFRLLDGDRLAADVNLKIRERIPVGLTIVYRLKWASPNLIAEVEGGFAPGREAARRPVRGRRHPAGRRAAQGRQDQGHIVGRERT
ncbi:hypothetical protein [Cohnella rhizosphaerae]|uniref:Uncharacterized protein n=1 Tax=Cohnella rhizosphaerae TaxID=1457232 RepID=A0A9X4KRV4_9BACL|nr:hypothetical protein [Cohnella rhizosphaerae]MDG0809760.1 hypothetical protein [Cohnella rhizosphaerae]